jgi:ribosomal protein S18 acetylase RimI-like enzyme
VIWACTYTPWARAGIAGRLLDKLIETMVEHEGIRIIMADTDPENVPAVKFFTKKGFLEQKPHVYLSTNLETNPRYSHLIEKSRKANRLKLARKKSKNAARSKKRIK